MKISLDQQNIERIFSEDGPISKNFDGYSVREEQVDMAVAVANAMENYDHLIVEAPTGLGKSYAYLVPALMSGKTVIVATANKSLQNQLADKDVPNLIEMLGLDVEFAVAKGVSNYVCHNKWYNYTDKDNKLGISDTDYQLPAVQEIKLGLSNPEFSGDVEYLRNSLTGSNSRRIVSFSNDCLGQRCDYYENDCYVNKMREKAFSSSLIITNHHLLLYSLKPEHEDRLLPKADIYIIDEAHNLESAATLVFQTALSNNTISQLFEGKAYRENLGPMYAEIEEFSNEIFFKLDEECSSGSPISYKIPEFLSMAECLWKAAIEMGASDSDEQFALLDSMNDHKSAEMEKSAKALKELSGQFKDMSKENESFVRYKKMSQNENFIEFDRDPISPAAYLRSLLFKDDRSVVCTSATLTTNGNFNHFRLQCGLPKEYAEEIKIPHIFDYKRQAFLYQPNMAKFNYAESDKYYNEASEVIRAMIDATDGNTLCLFNSWAGLNTVFNNLVGGENPVIWPTRSQGERVPRRKLLEWFQNTNHSVLCATRSFWEGIDVPGDSLKSVIMDKLPFPNPKDPVHNRRMKILDDIPKREGGIGSFAAYSMPHMALTLKQGFGRLIRNTEDTGVVTVLDSRLSDSRYGKTIRKKDLPPVSYSRNLADVFRFVNSSYVNNNVYGINLYYTEYGFLPSFVEFTVPAKGLRATENLKMDSDCSFSDMMHLSLIMLRERVERGNGDIEKSSLRIRCPKSWFNVDLPKEDLNKKVIEGEVLLWRDVQWILLEKEQYGSFQ